MNVNKVIAAGRVGRDPEIRHTANGKAVANFSVAVSEKYGEKENTEWFSVVSWGKQAEFVGEKLRKGARVLVIGRQQTRKWSDKEGNSRTSVELVAENVQLIDWPEKNGSVSRENADIQSTGQQSEEPPFNPDDDIPF